MGCLCSRSRPARTGDSLIVLLSDPSLAYVFLHTGPITVSGFLRSQPFHHQLASLACLIDAARTIMQNDKEAGEMILTPADGPPIRYPLIPGTMVYTMETFGMDPLESLLGSYIVYTSASFVPVGSVTISR